MLRAAALGLVAAGHDVDTVSWTEQAPREQLPAWASHRPLHRASGLRDHLAAVVRPRWASSALDLTDDGRVWWAEDPLSWAAVDGFARTGSVLHYSCLADARALGRVTPHALQGHRSDRRAVARAAVPTAYSARVSRALGGRAAVIPAAVEIPAAPVDPVDRPVALLLADWGWPPNAAALRSLLADWPRVRDTCPGAELLLAGRRAPSDLGTGLPGVRVLGEVGTATEAFARCAVLAFPCPPTTGPKTKVLEALAAGLPVVTTEAGVEGLVSPAGCEVATSFSERLATVLRDEELRARLAREGRASVTEHHGPQAAATARSAPWQT
jgi:hypothetical protein